MPLLDLLAQDTEYRPEAPATGNEWVQDVLTKPIPEGQRNSAYTRLAGLLRSRGLDGGIIQGILSAVNKSQGTGLAEKEIQGITKSVSRYTPKQEARQPQTSDILTVHDCYSKWENNRLHTGSFSTGWARLDACIVTFAPGEVLTIAGRSGTHKTNLGLQVSRRIAGSLKSNCLFCSLEMNAASIFFRLANEHHSCNAQEAKTAAETIQRIDADFAEVISQKNAPLLFVDKDSLTLEQIETYLLIARERTPIELLTVDYLGYIQDTERGNTYEHVSRISKGIKALAKRHQIRIILLCQTSRLGTDGTEPVQLHHLRDSGTIEESADYILGLWHGQEDSRIHCEVLKNRTGARGTRFDFINQGLQLIECDYLNESKSKISTF